jgi:uncharacterized protein
MFSVQALQQPELARFCRRHHIRRLSLFGSHAKGLARHDSDVDLLVEFEPDKTPGLLALSAMENELGQMLGGQKVDLRTPGDLSRHFRDQVMREAVLQYAA